MRIANMNIIDARRIVARNARARWRASCAYFIVYRSLREYVESIFGWASSEPVHADTA